MKYFRHVIIILLCTILLCCIKKNSDEKADEKTEFSFEYSPPFDVSDSIEEGKKNVAIFDYDRRENEQTIAYFIQKELKSLDPDLHITSYSGLGSDEIAIRTIQKLDEAGLDLLILITSDALLIGINIIKKTPTIFTNANNPRFLGFERVVQMKRKMTGATYYVPIVNQMNLYLNIMPDLKRAGFIFDQTNQSMRVEVKESRNVCRLFGIDLLVELVKTKEELPIATEKLLNKGAQCIIITSSNRLYDNIDLIKEETDSRKIPIFSFNKKGVKNGAVAALAVDYYDLAREIVIPLAMEHLNDQTDLAAVPYRSIKNPAILINKASADTVGITIPGVIMENAVIY